MRKVLWLVVPIMALALGGCASGPQTKSGSSGAGTQQGTTGTSRYGIGSNGASQQSTGKEQGQSQASANSFQNPNSDLNKTRIYFAFNSSDIKPKYKKILNAHAQYLTNHPNAHVRLEGNTDPRGTREYNLALGERRAKSVAQYLELQGVSSSQITTISFGEERLAVQGNNPQAWAKDRRVHIVYTNKGNGGQG